MRINKVLNLKTNAKYMKLFLFHFSHSNKHMIYRTSLDIYIYIYIYFCNLFSRTDTLSFMSCRTIILFSFFAHETKGNTESKAGSCYKIMHSKDASHQNVKHILRIYIYIYIYIYMCVCVCVCVCLFVCLRVHARVCV